MMGRGGVTRVAVKRQIKVWYWGWGLQTELDPLREMISIPGIMLDIIQGGAETEGLTQTKMHCSGLDCPPPRTGPEDHTHPLTSSCVLDTRPAEFKWMENHCSHFPVSTSFHT
jgi:hypothetical protein